MLSDTFSIPNMQRAWKKYVRKGLRDQETVDLFDYNDFHWNREKRFADLRQLILSGNYKPGRSIPFKIEKKFGVCRTVVTPSPEDSLILQCLVESLISKLLKNQPTSNAFFSRSHQTPEKNFTFAKDYIWFTQWKKFAKFRIKVASSHNFVATTDIANYFDNVQYGHLRNIISTFDDIEEVTLDLIFGILESLCWRPDYLPAANIGLPQVQFDAPRLLAHVYLYEIDSYLNKATNGTFVRWVDDITFAADDEDQCKLILRDLDTLLQMRGIRLNSGKTHVMPASTARRFFYQRENENLTRWTSEYEKAMDQKLPTGPIILKVSKSFNRFIDREKFGHYDKIIKRFIGFAAKSKSDFALDYTLDLLPSNPELRNYVYWYASELPPSTKILKVIEKYLFSSGALDDTSQCQIAKMLTDWEVEPSSPLFSQLVKLADEMGKEKYVGNDTFRFVAALWMLTKYSTQARIVQFVRQSRDIWQHSEFLSRQVAAASGKFRDPKVIEDFSNTIRSHGLRSSITILDAIDGLRKLTTTIPPDLRLYILNGKQTSTYTLQRFLIAFTVLSSASIDKTKRNALRLQLIPYLRDPHYKNIIQKIP